MVRGKFAGLVMAFALLVTLLVASPPGAAASASPTWAMSSLPMFSNSDLSMRLNSVSCWASGGCLAVGVYTDSTSAPHLFSATLANGSWTTSAITDPGANPYLSSVSCVSSSFCVAVGAYGAGASHRLAETYSNSTWTPTLFTDAGLDASYASDVSCSSVNFCAAVGTRSDTIGPFQHASVGRLISGTWTWDTNVSVPGFTDAYAQQVSCPVDDDCQIALATINAGVHSAAAAHLHNGVVTTTGALEGAGVDSAWLNGLTCSSVSHCIAFGGVQLTGTLGAPTTEFDYDGVSWTKTSQTFANGDDLTAVSCGSNTNCVASANLYDFNGVTLGARRLSAGTWADAAVPLDPNWIDGSMNDVSCTAVDTCVAVGSSSDDGALYVPVVAVMSPAVVAPPVVTPPVVAASTGYYTVGSDGGVFAFGNASFYGSAGGLHLNAAVVGMATTPSGHGYWLVASDGGVFAYGDAVFHGSAGGLHLNKPIVGIASTPTGNGYWLVASDGGIFAYGDASFYGSTGPIHLNAAVVGMSSTPSGHGYWLVASDGGIFAYGDAAFYGSTGGKHLNAPVVGMSSTPSGHGYWLIASDGGIFAYGDALFYGSAGGTSLNAPIVGMSPTASGAGYWLVARDGGIFAYGDAVFYGSTGGQHLNAPVVDIAA